MTLLLEKLTAETGPAPLTELHPAGPLTATFARLRYVSDTHPGIRRMKAGRSFRYIGPGGEPVRDAATLQRIERLGIPPAWTAVWICPRPDGHIQATGRDAKGRKQYRYHERWRAVRDETKYDRMILFGEALPRIRARIARHLALPGLPREKVLATVVQLLETTLIRVGNDEYARKNRSYGLTTLRDRHVDVRGSTLRFHFRGKSGKEHTLTVRDRRLARIVQRCQDLPGQDLFQYVDVEGERRTLSSSDVNEYLREISGQDFTAKDFRTWAGTLYAFLTLREAEPWESETQAKKNVTETIKSVAERLGNTPTVCRKCYVHPAVLDAYLDTSTRELLAREPDPEAVAALHELQPDEAAVLAFLKERCVPVVGVGH
jgi:DNA topoisomerase I